MLARMGQNLVPRGTQRALRPFLNVFSAKSLVFCFPVAAAMLLFGHGGIARAEGFALYEYSARGIALGGAMMARTPDASAVAYNPAQITRLKGGRVMAGASMISPAGKMRWEKDDGSSGSSKLKNLNWFVPHAYYTQQINDDWYFGIGEFTRYGLGFEYPHEWPGNENIYEVSLTTFSVNPNIAWRATDSLSLAAGVEVVYGNLNLKKRTAPFRDAMGIDSQMDINMRDLEDVGYGFNLAAHYRFTDQWALGVQYRSQVKAKLKGDVEFSDAGLPPGFFPMLQSMGIRDGSVSTKVTLPDSVAAGVAWTPVPEFSLEAGAVWTRWSTFNKLDFSMPHGQEKAENPKKWRDVWRINVGAEWQALDWLALRAGYVFDESPMTSMYEDYLVPTDDRHIFSAGFGLKWEDWTADFAYAYIHAIGRRYGADGYTHTLDSKAHASTTRILSVSVGYAF